MDALPERLSVREMAAAAGVSLGMLQRAFAQASHLTPVAHVQLLCLQAARSELETGAPGATVFAIARRWGLYQSRRRLSRWLLGDLSRATLRHIEAGARTEQIPLPAAEDHVVCLECGRKSRRLRRHLAAAHGLTPHAYRQRWGLRHNYPPVCAELSRQIAVRARANDLAGKGA
jgi:methylphosphotriester-DNA--protein-cysteine methyltransferase